MEIPWEYILILAFAVAIIIMIIMFVFVKRHFDRKARIQTEKTMKQIQDLEEKAKHKSAAANS